MHPITLKSYPEVSLISQPVLVDGFQDHLKRIAIEINDCGNDDNFKFTASSDVTDAAKLCEIAGRNCYMSLNRKMGRKTTHEYIQHIKEINHKSVLYHANFTFLISGISRRVSMELNRHIIGVSRSQLSTRFVPHNGCYILHPGCNDVGQYEADCYDNYEHYLDAIDGYENYKGLERKRLLEVASNILNQGAETVEIVTFNVESFTKMFYERTAEAADLEFRQLALEMAHVITSYEPELFADIALQLDGKNP